MKFFFLLLLLSFFCFHKLQAQETSYSSSYTSLKFNSCKKLGQGEEIIIKKCSGLEGYTVLFSAYDIHTRLTIQKNGKKFELAPFGESVNMPTINGTPMEWYFKQEGKQKKLIGLIFRVVGEDKKYYDQGIYNKSATLLNVFKVSPNNICAIGATVNNEEAREWLKKNKECLNN